VDKTFLVAKREFLYNLRRPSFIFATIGTPLIIVVVFAIIAIVSDDGIRELGQWGKVGYVDLTTERVLGKNVVPAEYEGVFVAYPDSDSARAALDNEEIIAYLELPQLYMMTGRVNVYSYQDMPDLLEDSIAIFIIANLTAGVELPLPLKRLQEMVNLQVRDIQSGRETSVGGVFATLFLPIIFAVVLFASSQTSSGFLMQGLVEERTNRVIEILVTSIKPLPLLTGKLIGLSALGLVNITFLVLAAFIALTLGQNLEFLRGLSLPLDLVAIAVVYFFLTYFMIGAIMITISVLTQTEQESRQIGGFIALPFWIPYMLIFFFFTDPNGPLPTIMTYIPFTAPLAVMMRFAVTEVPLWQVGISMAIMAVTTLGMIWAAARIFRWGMLLYGKKFNLFEIIRVVFSRQTTIGTTAPVSRAADNV
jgi:ABC-2 type transport system permease protein